jgi:hypothetical protein
VWSLGGSLGWRCPDEAALCSYVEQKAFGSEREHIERHLAECDACRDQIGFLLRAPDESTPAVVPSAWLAKVRTLSPSRTKVWMPTWQWGTAAAAACVLLLAATLWERPRSENQPVAPTASPAPAPQVLARSEAQPLPPAAPAPVVRNQVHATLAPEVVAPKPHSTVAKENLEFRWQEIKGALGYEVRVVNAEGDVLWEQRAQGHSVKVPSSLAIQPSGTYFLWVRADLPDGRAVQSKAIPFTISDKQ